MRLIPGTGPDPGEPDGGWESGPQLYTQELLTLHACKYSGVQLVDGRACPMRTAHQHRDEPCEVTFARIDKLPTLLAGVEHNLRAPDWGRRQ